MTLDLRFQLERKTDEFEMHLCDDVDGLTMRITKDLATKTALLTVVVDSPSDVLRYVDINIPYDEAERVVREGFVVEDGRLPNETQ